MDTRPLNRFSPIRRALSIAALGAVVAFVPLSGPAGTARAADAATDAVAARVERFRKAQFEANAAELTALTAPELSYSHSDGRVEDQATFVRNATAPGSTFRKLEYRQPVIRVVGDNAIVRFNWVGEQQATADNKLTATNLHILMVWQQQGGQWKLLARGSTKL